MPTIPDEVIYMHITTEFYLMICDPPGMTENVLPWRPRSQPCGPLPATFFKP
jgi:hypothetical protein